MKLPIRFIGDGRNRLSGRYRLRPGFAWVAFAAMVACCLCLSLVRFPDGWRVAQNLAALVQAFLSGLVLAQWLPIWEPAESESPLK